ncbi:pyridoxamine 5-phosphate oxidase [Pseudomonas protegens]|uniref:DegT/DnrJ/EryC1/StrS family aminotransferase n=1 Tax=Pseudomonas TaxID=286 RepID=UPI000D82FAAA|nr:MULTISPECIES: DegT/DnrJ/EryC1/StrS family aminotransferase [Pseudomonas]MDD1019196.1 DegT/DnrJ/EryC1/StrS family aminotransferase [Pseudomonas idahonensis]MDP9535360.1 DegT/DnrJ/EryC1/StrS family aminotransferase [Pseudomonas protegens]PYC00639.1 pyridoxamine 5-phosphate oxidase [Pseudomonas protegens]
MSIKFPLATSSWEKEELDAMQRVIASGMFTMGEQVKKFEHDFAEYVGSKHCVMVNSGSSANLLIVAALFYTQNPDLKLKRGDEVIVPAVSWSTTYYPLYQYGLKIKFVDIDLHTLNYDLDQLESAVTDKTRAIMAVNLLGNPNDFGKIQQIIGDRKIVLIEDNCESMGATYQGKQAGTFGVMGSFSSFFSHHISTMEGGLIVTDDEELYQILLSLRAHGWTRNLPKENLVCSEKSDDPFEESFRFVLPGYNVRPLELEGALGVEQVKRLPQMIEERRKNGLLLQSAMSTHPDIIIQHEIGQSSWFGFSLVIRPGSKLDRKTLVTKLNDLGFECRPIVAGNFAKNEVVKYFDSEVHGSLKNAEHIDQHGLFIGNHHYAIPDAFNLLRSIEA